jgi:5-methylthioribose kinase
LINIENGRALLTYLREKQILPPGDETKICKLKGGVSNLTVLVKSSNRPPFVVKQALAKLRVALDWYSSPERIHREALGLKWLEKLAPPGTITPLVFEDRNAHLIGMAAVPEPYFNWKWALLDGKLEMEQIERFAVILAAIHRHSFERHEQVARMFDDRSFFEELRLVPYYRYTASQVPASRDFYGKLIEETLATRLALVHGDYSPKNILIHASRLVLIDHEVIHFGDPAFDVGFSLTHLLSKAHHVGRCRAAFITAAHAYTARYLKCIEGLEWGEPAEPRAVRHTLGCLMARVAGRSPLEYLTPEERREQLKISLALMADPPRTLAKLIDAFSERLPCAELPK